MMAPRFASDLLARFVALPVAPTLLARLGAEQGVYLVGGAVRDLLLGRVPGEIDLALERDIDGPAHLIGAPTVVHDRFQTATVELDGVRVDLARCRRERYTTAGALPEVEPASLGEDLRRRDFTVNAIALALTGERAGALIPVPHALDDLAAGVLRVLHRASFSDDPTRLLRLVRYRARLGFTIEPGTARLVQDALGAGAFEWVSGERLGAELRLLASEEDPAAALRVLGELGAAEAIEPGFGLSDPARGRRALALLGASGNRADLILGLALESVAETRRAELMDRLGFRAGERETMLAVAARARPLAEALNRATRPSQIAAAAVGASGEVVSAAGALGPEEPARDWLENLRHVRTEIGGADLLGAGVPPGPDVGTGLRAALAAKLDGQVHSREQELDEALRAARPRK